MRIAKGVSVGPYRILSPIGAGGMGEVWRARDERIGRDVAVKVLPESFNQEAVKRFEQEARAAGSLSHPGLVTIFDVGTAGEWPYIVMELLEGESLRDVIGDGDTRTPLPPRKAIDYAAQAATALAVAHDRGIIHRDLKPENLFVTPDRRVKILDFGLAKLAADATDADGRKRTSQHLTGAGFAVGTPAYMSPEQVRAAPVDHRTDIFSLGVILYEMLTGKHPFEMPSAVETMSAVLNDDPQPIETLVPAVSPALAALVRHCLEKNPRERFRSAHDLAFHLLTVPEMLQTSGSGVPVPTPLKEGKARSFRTWMIVAPIVLAAAAGGFALRALRRPAPPAEWRAYKQLTFGDGVETDPAIAPDGKSFAYALGQPGHRDIYVQRVDGRAATNLTGDSGTDNAEPAFSPDGSKIAFRSERDGGGIYVMGVTGESVRRLTTALGHNPSWSPDGTRIVFSTASTGFGPHYHRADGTLRIVDTRDGTNRLLLDRRVTGVETDALQPSWSPHGKRIAFWGVSGTDSQRQIWTIDPEAEQPMKTLVRVTSDVALHWNPVWSPDGRFLYFGSDRDGTLNLWRIAIDETTGNPEGAPEPVSLPASFSGSFSISQRGEVVFNTLNRSYRLLALPFDVGSGRTGEPRVLFGGAEEILTFEPSPDGRSVAYTTGGGAQEDVFVANADGTRLRQLTNDAARDRSVSWSADGKTLYFFSDRGGSYRIWRIGADGSGLTAVTDDADLKRVGATTIFTPSPSPDGRTLLAQARKGVFVHPDRPSGQRLEPIPAPVVLSGWSPDGTRLVGTDSRRQIILYSPGTQRLEGLAVAGSNPRWLADGRHIAFFDAGRISVFDLPTRSLKSSALPLPAGVDINAVRPRLSIDGATLYLRQRLEQGDVWLMRPGKE
ncbi:MAG TPA: protein kinase [Thermoanaerobaculia bacterium]|jgi:Tol biopolymer transport system component